MKTQVIIKGRFAEELISNIKNAEGKIGNQAFFLNKKTAEKSVAETYITSIEGYESEFGLLADFHEVEYRKVKKSDIENSDILNKIYRQKL